MYSRFFTFIFLLFVSVAVFAQASLQGRVVDENGTPISNVSIELQSTETTPYGKYEVSGADGSFTIFDIPALSYTLLFSASNYGGLERLVELKEGENQKLGDIVLPPSSSTLEEVQVVARKKPTIEVFPDKTVFNVANSPTSSGQNGLELLRKAPGVVVDNQDNIILRGSQGVRVFIDDKPTYMSGDQLTRMLASLRAEDIESIEIITSPSAKYESEGTAGIINIKMKKNKKMQGWIGSLTADVSGLLRPVGVKTPRGSYGGTLTYTNAKTSVMTSYNFSNGLGFFEINSDRLDNKKVYRDYSLSVKEGSKHNIRLNVDHTINEKHSIVAGLRVGIYDHNDRSHTYTNIDTTLPIQRFKERLTSDGSQLSKDLQFFPTLSYYYKDTVGNSLNLSVDYSWLREDGNNYIPNRYYSDRQGLQLLRENIFRQKPYSVTTIFATKADYAKQWSAVQLEAGVKMSAVQADNLFTHLAVQRNVDILDPSRSSAFVYDETILAAYAQLKFPLGKFSLSFGLRNEYTSTIRTTKHAVSGAETSKQKQAYNDLFPSFGIAYTPSQMHTVSLQYSRRIQRPPYGILNPIRRQISELQYQSGNPSLNPQYANKAEITYSFMQTVSLSVSYLHTENIFSTVLLRSDEVSGVIEFTNQNVGRQQIFSVNLSSPLFSKKASWWSGFFNLSYTYIINEGVVNRGLTNEEAFHNEIPNAFSVYMEQNFKLPKGFSVSLSGWLNTESVWQSTIQFKTFGSLDFAVQKKFFKGKVVLKAYYTDVLSTAFVQFNSLAGARSFGQAYWPAQRIGLNFSYKFGKQTNKKPRRRSAGSKEEVQRASGGGGMLGG